MRAGWHQRRWLRWTLRGLAGLGGALTLYLLAALIGSFVPDNADWREAERGVTIYVETNGVHTGIVVPAAAEGIDLSLTFRATDLPDPDNAGDWLAFGWGDRDFYMNTPTWAELSLTTAAAALSGTGSTLLHVDHLTRPRPGADQRPVRLTREEYSRLIDHIMRTVAPGPDGRPVPLPGYGERDVFYEARGSYSLFRSCNIWTRDALDAAGVRVGRWTLFSGGVMRWFTPPR